MSVDATDEHVVIGIKISIQSFQFFNHLYTKKHACYTINAASSAAARAHLHLEYLRPHTDVDIDKHHSASVGGVCDDEGSGPLSEMNAVRDLRRHCVAHLHAGKENIKTERRLRL